MDQSATQRGMQHFLSDRTRAIDASGIRRVFELGATLDDPINFSIGQPDFPVPEPMKLAAIDAIRNDRNGYTITQGNTGILDTVWQRLRDDVGWSGPDEANSAMITSGTSGGLLLAYLALINPGDEAIIPDPYFVMYPQLATIAGGCNVYCETYPDFRMTAERVEPLLTDRTKLVLLNSPSNPCGTVLRKDELCDLVELCRQRDILLLSDEIYDEFTYADAREDGRFPSPATMTDQMLLVRGFGKTYACTGWRMGFAAGPGWLIQEMAKLQQYTFVCAPSIAQAGCAVAYEVDMSEQVAAYASKRDRVVETLGAVTDLTTPGGAFYAFVKVPSSYDSATAFVEEAIDRNVLIIPGKVFSQRDTHFRLSYAVGDDKLNAGLEILAQMLS